MNKIEIAESIEKELSLHTDQGLLDEEKRLKSFSILNAFMIGFVIGIILYSVAKNSWGLLSLLPLYIVYKLVNDPKNIRLKVTERLIKERNLKQ